MAVMANARALQPKRIAGSLVELQQSVAVASGAVAQVRPLGEWPGVPSQLSPLEKQGLEVRRGKGRIRERGHHPRRAMAVLAQKAGLAARHDGRPSRTQLGADRMRRKGLRHGVGHHGALVGRQPIPAMKQRQHVAGEAVHRAEPALNPSIQVLCPDRTAVDRLKLSQQPGRLHLEQRLEPGIPGHGVHVHAGQHGAWQPPHELHDWQVGVCCSQNIDLVGKAHLRRDAHRDQLDAQLPHQQRRMARIARGRKPRALRTRAVASTGEKSWASTGAPTRCRRSNAQTTPAAPKYTHPSPSGPWPSIGCAGHKAAGSSTAIASAAISLIAVAASSRSQAPDAEAK